MFSLDEPKPGFPRNLKRLHEDDAIDPASASTIGFTEHRNKRLHALPLRTSPTARRWSPPTNFFQSAVVPVPTAVHPQNITPADSDSEETANANCQQQAWSAEIGTQQLDLPSVVEAADMDMDDAMDVVEPIPQRPLPGRQNHLTPGPFQPDAIATTITGRMPTPIQPSFAAQVRGNNWGGAAGNIMQTGLSSADRPATQPFGLGGVTESTIEMSAGHRDQSVPRSLDHAAMNGWNMPQMRSLPSPISESGGEDMGSPDMVLDSHQIRSNSFDNPHSAPLRCHSAMSLPHLPLLGSMADELSGAGMDPVDSPPGIDTLIDPTQQVVAINSDASMDTDPPATPSPRKGHSRSRHTVNSWTLQPGMKKSFSIGYRADCEKCRNKVPGHFNHIIVS